MSARLDTRAQAPPAGHRPAVPAPAAYGRLTWPRLPGPAEVITAGAGYAAYSLIRLTFRAGHHAAFAHAALLWRAERHLHLNVEPTLNHLTAIHPVLADTVGYYYGLLHFIVTPLVIAWLYLRRPAAFPRLRSALFFTTAAANVVFWTWPLAPPRFTVPGVTDILIARDILGAANPHGATSLVNLYAAMPSLHVAWAAWCAFAVVSASRTRWRHLAWLYPSATTFAVLASANHFVLDAAGGLAVAGLGVLAASWPLGLGRAGRDPRGPGPRNPAASTAASPAGTGARRARLPRRNVSLFAGALAAGIAAVTAMRMPSASADVHAALARMGPGRMPWLGAAAAAEALSLACSAAAQHHLLAVGGVRFPKRAMAGLALASAGLGRLMPAGPVSATAWLTGQYRRRGAHGTLGLWAVLSGGFAASVTLLTLLLAGAAIAGLGSPALLAAAAVILTAGSAGFIGAAHHLDALTGWLLRRHPGTRAARRLAAAASLWQLRAGYRRGTAVLLFASLKWLTETIVLAASFQLAGQPIPWHGLLLAYAASQLAGSLIPLPGGLGSVEGGLIGALTLTGTSLGAAAVTAVIYRVLCYWTVGAAGTCALAVMRRRLPADDRSTTPAASQLPWCAYQAVTRASPEAPKRGRS